MYHLPTCHHCSNESIPLSLAEALFSGYTPCRSCKPPAQSEYPPPQYPIEALALPYCENPEAIIHYKGFSLLYSEEHEQAFWVAYCLTREEEAGSMSRPNNFRPDPNIATGSAEQADYDNKAYPEPSGEGLRKIRPGTSCSPCRYGLGFHRLQPVLPVQQHELAGSGIQRQRRALV